MPRIYLDHAATTNTDTEVLETMMPYFGDYFGNASSVYREGQRSREAIDDARLDISKILDCSLEEIIFTSGATESNNLAIKGVLASWKKRNPEKIPEVITSTIEHSSVKKVFQFLEESGQAKVHWIPVDRTGILDLEYLKSVFSPEIALVSIMAVNNEVGSVQPVSRIGKMCEKNGVVFLVDAVQCPGYFPLAVDRFKSDLLSFSAHKFYGPRGIGILRVKKGTEMLSETLGGGQERGYRSGTENVAGIMGMATALQKAELLRETETLRMKKLQEYGVALLKKHLPEAIWNGPECGELRHPANLHFSLPEVSGESFLMRMDLEGVALSLGSACSSGLMGGSPVLLAMGISEDLAQTGVRITMGRTTTEEDLETAFQKMGSVYRSIKMG
ncbi:MAG: cysteine desulfurase family protein [Candidatus Peregrinibacteria bacterium]